MKKTNFKKIFACLLTGILLAVAIMGCGSSSGGGGGTTSGAGVKIYFSTITLDDFKKLVMDGVINAGAKNGVTVDYGTPCDTVDAQVAEIAKAASSGYDVIICNPVNVDTTLQLEVAAGDIPILFTNSEPDASFLKPDKYMYVGSYEQDAGLMQAEYVWNKLGKPSSINICLFSGEPSHPAATGRTKAVKKFFK